MNPLRALLLSISVIWFIAITLIIFNANNGSLKWIYVLADAIPYFDKLGHAFLYGGLSFFCGLSIKKALFAGRVFAIPLGSVTVLVAAILEECSQLFNPHRTFDLIDLSINIATVVLFGMLAKWCLGQMTNGRIILNQ